MAFLQIISLVLLLQDVLSSTEFSKFSCEPYVGERGKNTNITCKSNHIITDVTMKFCSYNESSCPEESEINTFAGKYTSDDGRISLMLDNFAILIFNNVQISDEGYYNIFLKADKGYDTLNSFLNIVAPYTKPQITRKNETVVCTAAGGYPIKHLYWYDNNGTNLTHNSKCEHIKGVKGSYSLKSSLQLDSFANEMTYCCTFNNRDSSHPLQSFDCMTFENGIFNKSVSENTTINSILIPFLIIIVAVAIAGVLYFRKKKGGTKLCRQQDPVAYLEKEFPLDVVSHRRVPILEESY